ncbi:MAG: hypothetical protein QOD93_2261 [Acetobacteraceae bacterium]|jgi:hypothetical protein|nr:hypothetical protein [Acetobacteraceae bacterium]MEA2769299.1 hypothetical protein [Acetobacteraceae bacterium]
MSVPSRQLRPTVEFEIEKTGGMKSPTHTAVIIFPPRSSAICQRWQTKVCKILEGWSGGL